MCSICDSLSKVLDQQFRQALMLQQPLWRQQQQWPSHPLWRPQRPKQQQLELQQGESKRRWPRFMRKKKKKKHLLLLLNNNNNNIIIKPFLYIAHITVRCKKENQQLLYKVYRYVFNRVLNFSDVSACLTTSGRISITELLHFGKSGNRTTWFWSGEVMKEFIWRSQIPGCFVVLN